MKNFIFIALSVSFSFITLYTFNQTVFAETVVDQDIAQDTVWVPENDPYIITEPISVSADATLTIKPGTHIIFDNADMTIFGKLEAFGQAEKQIYFTSEDTVENSANTLGGLLFANNSSSTISYANIDHLNDSFQAMNARVTIEASDISLSDRFDLNHSVVNIADSRFHTMKSGILFAHNRAIISVQNIAVDDIPKDSLEDVFEINSSSNLTLSHSKIKNSGLGAGVSIYDFSFNAPAEAHVEDSVFESNESYQGILAFGFAKVFMNKTAFRNFLDSGIFALNSAEIHVSGSTLESNKDGILLYNKAHGDIASSSIINNSDYGLLKFSTFNFSAENNWWGSPTGPFHSTLNPEGKGNAVSDTVKFEPWLTEEPNKKPKCCSNVIFIPGIEGSRLYVDGQRVWEPNITSELTQNIQKLYLDASGKSINTVATKDIIDSGFTYDVYGKFIDFMNQLVTSGSIKNWQAFPYDWRQDVRKVVSNDILLPNSESYNMLTELEKVASSSNTGKVTIIAHSNGGLIAKALIKYLQDQNREDLIDKIDKIIFIAVPHLGTPLAIPTLLHGYGQALGPLGIAFHESTSRELGKNMPGGYGLLPSQNYFDLYKEPVITFNSVATSTGFQIYGQEIKDLSTLTDFLAGEKDGRQDPAVEDIRNPIKLSKSLLANTQETHAVLDHVSLPSSIQVFQIAGTGLDTLKSTEYFMKSPCIVKQICLEEDKLDLKPIFAADGDGTVMLGSASFLSATTYYLNLHEYNNLASQNLSHKDITEVTDIQNLLRDLVTNTPPKLSQALRDTLLDFSILPKRLNISIHSPALVDLYDKNGNHTGLVESREASTSDFTIEQNIPNSFYMNFGEGKYIGADLDSSSTLKIQGMGFGTFTLDIDETQGSTTIQHIEFTDIPVSPLTQASFSLSISTSTPQDSMLMLDIDGDAHTDYEIKSGQEFNPQIYLETLKISVKNMNLDLKAEKEIVNKIDKLLKLIQQDKTRQLSQKIKKLIKNIEYKKKFKYMSDKDKQDFINILSGLLNTVS
jgi:pimeloyl-ACP methyl ester carboxylesterase